MTESVTTIGVLYPGELGSVLAKSLTARGYRVVTTLAGRSPRTVRLCTAGDIEILASLAEVKEVANIILSTVVPAAATRVAESYCVCGPRTDQALYVDLNSISPMTAGHIVSQLSAARVDCVDGTIHGLAAQLHQRGTLYLSGDQAERIAALFDGVLRTKLLSPVPGAASAFKMMLGGMSKGLVALFMELCLAARAADVLDELLADFDYYYPGVMTVMQRLLPTYPLHASRRADELLEVQRTMLHQGLEANMVGAAQRLIAAIGDMQLSERPNDESPWEIRDIVEQVHLRQAFHAVKQSEGTTPAELTQTVFSTSSS